MWYSSHTYARQELRRLPPRFPREAWELQCTAGLGGNEAEASAETAGNNPMEELSAKESHRQWPGSPEEATLLYNSQGARGGEA